MASTPRAAAASTSRSFRASSKPSLLHGAAPLLAAFRHPLWRSPPRGSFSLSSYCRRVQATSLQRRHASKFAGIQPVDLSYDIVEPTTLTVQDQVLVICHGLFGSKQNWRSLAKAFAQRLGMPVYTLDLRNHGHSPHAEPHSYAAMAVDIRHFLEQRKLKSGVNLLGHSMGGKAAMAFALNDTMNGPLRSLISVDMSPAVGKMSPEFSAYTVAMMEVQEAKVKTKTEADQILKKVEPILATRQFLLTNTKITTGPDSHLTFRVPLELLSASILHIGDFPYSPPPPAGPDSPEWLGPTLFLKGEHSRYLNRHNIPIAQRFFPNMRLKVLDAGHWVHAERPAETVNAVEAFIKEGDQS